MKTTPEKLEELKAMAEHARSHFCIELAEAFVRSVPALIADLEEAQGMAVTLAPDALQEAEERKNIAAGLEAVWRGRMQDAETAHQAELAATRKQLEELRTEYSVTLDNLSAAYESVRAQWNLGYAEGSQEVKHWRANHDNVVAKLRLFTQREDLSVDRLPAYEYVLGLEKQLAAAQAREALTRNTLNTLLGCQPGDFSAVEASIAEAIADEKQNPWKQVIINELIVSHALRTDHETDPVKALAALVDYECMVALDPSVSKEAQALIEPYRKDAERYEKLRKLNVPRFAELYKRNIRGDGRFDTLVDDIPCQ